MQQLLEYGIKLADTINFEDENFKEEEYHKMLAMEATVSTHPPLVHFTTVLLTRTCPYSASCRSSRPCSSRHEPISNPHRPASISRPPIHARRLHPDPDYRTSTRPRTPVAANLSFLFLSFSVSMSPCYVIRRGRAPPAGCCAMCFVNPPIHYVRLLHPSGPPHPLLAAFKLPASPSPIKRPAYAPPTHSISCSLCWLSPPPLCSRAARWVAPPCALGFRFESKLLSS